MSLLSNELASVAVPNDREEMTLDTDESIVEKKIVQIWNVLQETNQNLNACDQLLENYSNRTRCSGNTMLLETSTQTSLPLHVDKLMSSSTQTYVPSPVHSAVQTVPHVDSLLHVAVQTLPDKSEVAHVGTQTCITQDSSVQTNSERDVQSVGLQTHNCERLLSNVKCDKLGKQCRTLCCEHCEAVGTCSDCYQSKHLEEGLKVGKTAQAMERTSSQETQGYQKIVDCFSSLEQHCRDMDVRLGSVLSLLEVLSSEIQSSVTRVFKQWTVLGRQTEEQNTKTEDVLAVEKQRRQRAEELLSVAHFSSRQAMQEMEMLNRRLVQLEETLAAERNNVVQLHKSRTRLSAQMHDIKCSLAEERVSTNSLSCQAASLNQEKLHLRARLSRSHARYRSQLADARRMLGSRNAKVKKLRAALIKVRDLCHSIDTSYRTMLWEIGKQVHLTAELVARDCGLEMLEGPVVTTLTVAEISEWYQQVWQTAKWIQMQVLTRSHEPHNEANLRTGTQPPQTDEVQQSSQPEGCEVGRTANHVKVDELVDGNEDELSDFSHVDLRNTSLSVDINSPVQTTVASTTCSSLSRDLSCQHELPHGGYQMQHRFLTILDNLKVKLLQIRPSNVQ